MIKGNCLCGRVKYEYSAEIDEVAVCHCDQCKLAQGTAFATNAPVDASKFKWLAGEDNLTSYFSSENKKRVFCATCGSPMYSQRTDLPETIRLRLGTITVGKIPEPHYQIFCKSESQWLVLDIEQPRYEDNKA